MLPHSSGLTRQPSIKLTREPSIKSRAQREIEKKIIITPKLPWYYRYCICGLNN